MNYKVSFDLLWVGLICGGIAGFFSIKIGVTLIALAIVQAALFYRCPHCRYSLLNVRGIRPSYCPNCGEDLSDQSKS